MGPARNFWIDLDVDGRQTHDKTGPLGKDGGFTATIYIRAAGMVAKAVEVTGRATHSGDLILTVEPAKGIVLDESYYGTSQAHDGFRIVAVR